MENVASEQEPARSRARRKTSHSKKSTRRAGQSARKSKAHRANKKAEVIAMLKRAKGATMAERLAAAYCPQFRQHPRLPKVLATSGLHPPAITKSSQPKRLTTFAGVQNSVRRYFLVLPTNSNAEEPQVPLRASPASRIQEWQWLSGLLSSLQQQATKPRPQQQCHAAGFGRR